jgi:hypothetical protein
MLHRRRPLVRAQPGGNALLAMNPLFSGTTTDDKDVKWKAQSSMRVNSESVSNEIDESDLQFEKHDEERI